MEALLLDKLSLEDKQEAQEQSTSTSSDSKSKSRRSGAARRKLEKERLANRPFVPIELIGHILDIAYPYALIDDIRDSKGFSA